MRPSLYPLASLLVWSLTAPLLATASASKLPWYAYLSYPGIALLLASSARIERKSDQAVILIATIAVLGWWLPVRRVWPKEAQYRGLAGPLWELTGRDPDVRVVPGPRFRLVRQRAHAGREARLYLRMILWRQSQRPSGESWCNAVLVNRIPPGGDVLELFRPERRSVGLFLVDDCYGRLRLP